MDNRENFSILMVDDDPLMVLFLRSMLADFSPLRFATCGKDALKLARKSAPDLILLDVDMPDVSGLDTCRAFKADSSLAKIPIIFLTSHETAELQTAGFALGAVDFISKPPNAALVLARVRAQMGNKRLSETLRSAITLDFLTGTANRLHFEKALQQEWLRARRARTSLCLVLLDIVNFSAYSTEHSEAIVEDGLREIADALRPVIRRPADLLARYSAGTFAALLPETESDGASAVAARAIAAVTGLQPFPSSPGLDGTSSLSIGIAYCRAIPSVGGSSNIIATHQSVEELMAAAEKALKMARVAGSHKPSISEIGLSALSNG